MSAFKLEQWTHVQSVETGPDDFLLTWIEAFLVDRKAKRVASGTVYFYQKKLQLFARFCDGQEIAQVTQLTPDTLRRYLLWLEETNHNPGGIHGCYRAMRSFLLWWEAETEPESWKNPIRKVKAPRISSDPQPGIELEDIQRMIAACQGPQAQRDTALFLALLDTGARASELLGLKIGDVCLITGEVSIRRGKGGKSRTTYLGTKSRRELRKYLKQREGLTNISPLFATDDGERLTYWGLRQILRRAANRAGVEEPGAHDFRRAFCLALLRQGVDVVSISRLMGHADITLVRRYANQTNHDLAAAHAKGSPVDLL